MKGKLRDNDIQVLPNGMRVLFVRNKKYKVSSIYLMLDGGAIFEKKGLNDGYSHIIEHMMFQSSEKYTKKERDNDFIKLGADYNGGTGNCSISYEVTAPSENINLVFTRFYDMIFHPLFKKDEFQNEIGAILAERASVITSPIWKVNQLVKENMYQLPNKKIHPYNNKLIGSEETIKAATVQKIKSFYQKFYQPANMVFVLVGDKFDEDLIIKKLLMVKNTINSSFLEEVKEKLRKTCKETRYMTGTAVEETKDHSESVLLSIESKTKKLIYHSLDRFNDYTTIYNEAMYSVFNNWLGETRSVLFQLFRDELGLVYGINSNTVSNSYIHKFAITTDVPVKKLDDFFFHFEKFANKEYKRFLPSKEQFKDLIQNIKYNKNLIFYDAYRESRELATMIIDRKPVLSLDDRYRQLDKITRLSLLDFIHYHFNEDELSFSCFIAGLGPKGTRKRLEKIVNQFQFNSAKYFV